MIIARNWELRRVPPRWQHPRDAGGRYIPQFSIHTENLMSPDGEYEATIYHEPPPDNWFQLYENVTEGTPISPAFPRKEELEDWMVNDGYFYDEDSFNRIKLIDLNTGKEITEEELNETAEQNVINNREMLYQRRDSKPTREEAKAMLAMDTTPPFTIYQPRLGKAYYSDQYADHPDPEDRIYVEDLESIRTRGGISSREFHDIISGKRKWIDDALAAVQSGYPFNVNDCGERKRSG